MNMVQHLSDATHFAGHTLDYGSTRNSYIAVLPDTDTVNVSSLLTDYPHSYPLTSTSLSIRPISPWYDDELIAAKQERRRCDSQWRTSKLTVHRQLYIEQRQLVMTLFRTRRIEFYSNQAKENPSNARIIFGTAKRLLQRNIEKPNKISTI